MATAGLYDDSGKWLYHTGLPAKSGVGGGIIAVAPGKFGIAVISPPLDDAGNSVRAQRAIAEIVARLDANPYAVGGGLAATRVAGGGSLALAASLFGGSRTTRETLHGRCAAPDARPDRPGGPDTDTATADSVYQTSIAGEFRPAKGFDIVRTKVGQPEHQLLRAVPVYEPAPRATRRSPTTWADVRTVKARNDLNWHRTFVWLTGFFYDPEVPLQHHALVAAHDAADAAVREPPVPCSPRRSTSASASRPTSRSARCRAPGRSGRGATGRWRRNSSAAGSRPASSSRAAAARASTTPPRSTPTSASSA